MKRALAILLAINLLTGMLASVVSAADPVVETGIQNVKVEMPSYIYYEFLYQQPKPVVTADGVVLKEGTDYRLTYSDNGGGIKIATVTVTGLGDYEGYESVHDYAVLKRDIATCEAGTDISCYYNGEPCVLTNVGMKFNGNTVSANQSYKLLHENNTNRGQATAYAVGVSDHYGIKEVPFEIKLGSKSTSLQGTYNGLATEELNGQVYVDELVMPAARFSGAVNTSEKHVAYYELYRVEGEEMILITTYESGYSYNGVTQFEYDFSNVYDTQNDMNGEIYTLVYSWVDSRNRVYVGMLVIGVYAQAPDATEVTMEHVENDGDFRREYFGLAGMDGNVGNVTWNSSDESVAVVEHGQVTFKKPGTVTITGSYGQTSAGQTVTAETQELTEGVILDYDPKTGKSNVVYSGFLLSEGVDYALTTTENNGITTVTVVGKGLFTGQLVREFTQEAVPIGHSHSFDNCEDSTCGTCTFEREVGHPYSQQWRKDETAHWHACVACGKQADYAEHTLSEEDETVCSVCGPLYTIGDLNGDEAVDEDDAIHLLRYVLLPEFYTVNQDVDYNDDSKVNEDDAIHLLRHVLLPEFYPL